MEPVGTPHLVRDTMVSPWISSATGQLKAWDLRKIQLSNECLMRLVITRILETDEKIETNENLRKLRKATAS